MLMSNARKEATRKLPDPKPPDKGQPPVTVGFPSRKLAYNHALASFAKHGFTFSPKDVTTVGHEAVNCLATTTYLVAPHITKISARTKSITKAFASLGLLYLPLSHPEVQSALNGPRTVSSVESGSNHVKVVGYQTRRDVVSLKPWFCISLIDGL